MTKVLNPAIRVVAGRKYLGGVAQIHHRGRRSGRLRVTPASARLAGDSFFIPLTFGSTSDWCRNVQAAGGCIIRWRGNDYAVVEPELIDKRLALAAAGPAFKPMERMFMKVMGIKQFLRLRLPSA